ncbi:copper-binding protein [Methylobacterium aquaticum]|jgi:Cu(I)/Ag(I) efflux system protein CusF|nr:copper-binding protein [Methylobacterium aquaticum]
MKRIVLLLAAGLALGQLAPFTSTAQAAWWESVQPEARIWMKKVDPGYQKHRSDDERPWVSAEVHGVDVENGALTIHHGPLPKVGMPAMTMSFPVRESVHFDMLRPGDKVQIQVADVGGVIRIINYRMQH